MPNDLPQSGLGNKLSAGKPAGSLPVHEQVKKQRAHDDYIRRESYDGGRLIGSKESYRPKTNSKRNKSAGLPSLSPIKYSHAGAVKTEFLIGLALLLLAPVGNPNLKIDKAYAKRLVAYLLLFMMLFPMGAAQSPNVSRLGALLGGVLLLSLLVVSHPTNGFAINFATLISTLVSKLQPTQSGAIQNV